MIGIVISELAADLERAIGNRPARNVQPSITRANGRAVSRHTISSVSRSGHLPRQRSRTANRA